VDFEVIKLSKQYSCDSLMNLLPIASIELDSRFIGRSTGEEVFRKTFAIHFK
jgi:hypothetical protein